MAAAAAPRPAAAELTQKPVEPQRIVWLSDSSGTLVKNVTQLLKPFAGQVSTADGNNVVMRSTASKRAAVLLDFGKELNGGLKIFSGMGADQSPATLHVVLGESVTEALSDVSAPGNPQNARNDHAMRDFSVKVPWLGTVRCGDSGFRFARIELVDTCREFLLRYVQAIEVVDNAPMVGSFECSDARLNQIWATGARTVQLCLQDYLWDGIKRDRLVWLGDTHPEVMAVNAVYGKNDIVNRSLDFGVADTPLPGWMNGYSAYSLWWLISQRDLMLHNGDHAYYSKNRDYIFRLVAQVDSCVDKRGQEHLDGVRFLDWPTSRNEKVIDSGLHSLIIIAMRAADELGRMAGDDRLSLLAQSCLRRVEKVKVSDGGNSQAAALSALATDKGKKTIDGNAQTIISNGPQGFSTFYGYYMLEALARAGKYAEAVDLMRRYWGAMLDLGATSFWEDLNYDQALTASRIDSIVTDGKHDIHAEGGAYCYVGLRLSMCHGWASGPTPWLSQHILGVRPVEAGCGVVEVDPHPTPGVTYAKGTYPTPYGPVKVDWHLDSNGKLVCSASGPKEVRIINKAAADESFAQK